MTSHKFKQCIINCTRCKKEIPLVDRTYSRKYCRECSVIVYKENRNKYQMVRKRKIEKPCFVCGNLTYRPNTCSAICGRKATKIYRFELSIMNKMIIMKRQLKQLEELRCTVESKAV